MDQEAAAAVGLSPAGLSQVLAQRNGVSLETAVRIAVWSEGRVPIGSWLAASVRRAMRSLHPEAA